MRLYVLRITRQMTLKARLPRPTPYYLLLRHSPKTIERCASGCSDSANGIPGGARSPLRRERCRCGQEFLRREPEGGRVQFLTFDGAALPRRRVGQIQPSLINLRSAMRYWENRQRMPLSKSSESIIDPNSRTVSESSRSTSLYSKSSTSLQPQPYAIANPHVIIGVQKPALIAVRGLRIESGRPE